MISVIIPAFNEANYINKTLSTLDRFVQNNDVEVIVVDNGSSDKTADICSQFKWVKLIQLNCRTTVADARNIGVAQSSGQCLVFIDADILVTEKWFLAVSNFAESIEFNDLIVTGNKVSVSQDPSWIETGWFACLKNTSASYINSGNLVCSKKLFNSIEGFNKLLKTGEDVDFCERAKKHGAQVKPDQEFFVYHEGYPKTLKAFFVRERWHGIGDTQSIGKFISSKVAVLSLFVALLTGCFLLAVIFGLYSYALLILSGLGLINFAVLLVRLKITSVSQFVSSLALNYIYLLARFTSIFSHRQNRIR
ncbi:glycosyltransferase [Cellvibrio sp. UBA7661]|uniref:glycosyltransferase n=1 Tax=Cellvibrio sp. UBA7661 TaxID=1946311 RepID=UPI002F361059